MSSARYIIGDVFDTLATLPDNSVDLVFSSPPFLALRSYLPADDPNKGKEIGSEATPADFLDTLLDVVEACDRVLAPHGSLCFELGDTYAGSGGAGGDYAEGGLRDGAPGFDGSQRRMRTHNLYAGRDDGKTYAEGGANVSGESLGAVPMTGGYGWPLPKSLSGIPTLFAWSLAYGRNLLRPERTTPRWRIRNVIVWARPNPPVGALGDKFRPATSYLTVACKSDKRWFDLDAVRSEHKEHSVKYGDAETRARHGNDGYQVDTRADGGRMTHGLNAAGSPPLDYWEIPTQPYPGSHYATMPSALIVKPVASMCPQRVCKICGEPSRRITERTPEYAAYRLATGDFLMEDGTPDGRGTKGNAAKQSHLVPDDRYITTGWTDCGCGGRVAGNDASGNGLLRIPERMALTWRNGVVLDPFAGSGTTLAVATGHGRDAIGIDIDARNAELALERVGPLFLTVETLTDPRALPPLTVETEKL